ncbi:BMC domain-containing protein [Peribacillus aracenensis]|uniref:BMC domain-containing protein n=1 Tax=Peribacillus aracenensis TaxID=2976708 RepID=UPI0021A4B4E9|nr:BMC domain-containing protein [Peribacillus sp. BBB004]
MKNAYALGLVETIGFPAMIAAADAASKAADVKITTYQGADAGIVTIYIVGDVSSVQSAVIVGEEAARRVGIFRYSRVLARPDDHVIKMLFPKLEEEKKAVKSEKAIQRVEQPGTIASGEKVDENVKELHKKSTQELRKLANSLSGFPLSPQEITTAKKEELIKYINALQNGKGGDK